MRCLVRAWDVVVADLWIAVAGVVTRTERLTLRPLVTPVSRQRARELACEKVTLSRLSRGRLVVAEGREVNSGGERLRRHR
jgi:alkanesulfonate monooxygenase SsuD/methylene tetrahydromethanopterin reductase-like flavin-dependent oxidoreductase (luciferase family)